MRTKAAAQRCAALLCAASTLRGAAGDEYDDWILAKARRGDPHCKPPEVHTAVKRPEKLHVLQRLGDGPTDRIRMNCIIVDVRHHPNSTNKVCGPQNSLPFKTWMVADVEDGMQHKWHIDNIMGGSVDEIVYSTRGMANFSLQFTSEHQNDDCDYWVTHSIDYCVFGKAGCPAGVKAIDVQYTLPTLTGITPTSVYKRDPTTFTFVQARAAHPGDRAKAIHRDAFPPGREDPCVYEGKHAFHMARGSEDDSEEVLEKGLEAYFTHIFHKVGLYYICYGPHQPDDDIDFQEVATVTVFGGNPDYFSMSYRKSSDPGKLPTYIFTFTGEHLDLRPHRKQNGSEPGQGDRAKLVYQRDDCSDELAPGVPGAGGTLLGTDMGPDDNPSTHEAEYYVHFRTGGRFRLCYQRYGHEWIEVPNIEDLDEGHFSHKKPGVGTPVPLPPAPGAQQNPDSSPLPTPAPAPGSQITHPSGGGVSVPDECREFPQQNVPPRVKPPSFPTVLQFTIAGTGGHLPSGFNDKLASLIGVPLEVIDLSDATVGTADSDKPGGDAEPVLHVKVDLHCRVWSTAPGVQGCSAREKKNLLIYLGAHQPGRAEPRSTCLRLLGVASVVEVRAAGTLICLGQMGKDGTCRSDGPVIGAAHHSSGGSASGHSPLFTLAMVVVTLAGIGVIAFAGVWAWRRNGYAGPAEMFASVSKGVPWGSPTAGREML